MPYLDDADVKRVINGPMMLSPDLCPLIGPHPALRNYFCANGVMAGFNQGAGIGKVPADWIIEESLGSISLIGMSRTSVNGRRKHIPRPRPGIL